ncbi:hypothetical protein DERF_006842 [Dermatophagoides farinae]|uniref:Uncharacterized protein n=1 Tax=Dermatophagoides farinae TaxID=6954 RepID=A0A922HX03_DERFA|nr:hypothetical protein DERF_006842 [Dermatophagoides farinae]
MVKSTSMKVKRENSLPISISTTSQSQSNINPESDLIAEYLINNLLRSYTPPLSSSSNENRKQNLKLSGLSRLPLDSLHQSLDDKEDLDQEDSNRLLSDFYTSLLYGTDNDDDNYRPSMLINNDDGHQEIGWFDGPVLPKVTALAKDYSDDTYLGDVDDDDQAAAAAAGYDQESVLEPSLVPYPYARQQIDNPDDTILDNPTLINALWTNYLTSRRRMNDLENLDNQIQQQASDDNDDNEKQQNLYDDNNDKFTIKGLELDKRRQKIIKHKNKKAETTSKPQSLSTAMKTAINTMEKANKKVKILHKTVPKLTSLKHSSEMMNGQKEYPMLRPASENNKNKEPESTDTNKNNNNNDDNNEWPSELDENNLAEEDSLKQLPKQQRIVRDTLTSQLSSLKTKREIPRNKIMVDVK